MGQPLPSWLEAVTLRYQDTDQFTVGLVELPISYSGPSIPLAWPFTSVQAASLTSSPPLPSQAPSVPQVVTFLDGSGPFTVLGDVILTSEAPVLTPSDVVPASRSSPTPSPSAPVIVVTTVIVSSPTASSQPSSDNSPFNPLVLGFVTLLLIILFLLTLAVAILLFKRQRRRRKLLGIISKYDTSPHEIHYEFNPRRHPLHHSGSHEGDHSRNLIDHEVPVIIRNDAPLDLDVKEKGPAQPETQFLITPQRQHKLSDSRWKTWKKLIPKLGPFGHKKAPRGMTAYDQPMPQVSPYYQNPYHDPSVATNTADRVSKWRMGCGSLSSSALQIPPISDYRDEPTPRDGLQNDQTHSPHGARPELGNRTTDDKVVFTFNPSSTVSGPNEKLQTRGYLNLKEYPPTSPSKSKSMRDVTKFLGLSPRHLATPPQGTPLMKSVTPSALIKASSRLSRSWGTRSKSSRATGKDSPSKKTREHSPPLLVAECEDESPNETTDQGDSPLDFITIPLRSPPRCRRVTGSSSGLAGLENSVGSIGLPESLLTSSPNAALASPVKMIRRKKTSFPASSNEYSTSLQLSTASPSSQILSSSPATRPIVLKKKAQFTMMQQANPQFCVRHSNGDRLILKQDSSHNESSLDAHLSHDRPRSDNPMNSRRGSALLFPMPPARLNSPIQPLDALDPGLDTYHGDSNSSRTHNSSTDEDIVFNGYFGSGSIGNTGGVSELGILETGGSAADQSLTRDLESDVEFPRSIHTTSVLPSLQSSSQLATADEYSCGSTDLFYVKPQPRRSSGNQYAQHLHDNANHHQSFEVSRSECQSYLSKVSSRADDGSLGRASSYNAEARRTLESMNAPACSSYYSTDADELARQASRRSVSSSVLGSIFSLAQGRRCVSFPAGMANDGESSAFGNYADIEPMLNDARSPLQRIVEKCSQLPRPVAENEDGEDEQEKSRRSESEDETEGDYDEEADESSRLLLAETATSSRCSRATLGQRLRMIQAATTESDTNSHNASVLHSEPSRIHSQTERSSASGHQSNSTPISHFSSNR